MPVATAEKITALSHDLGSQRRLAELLGVSPAQVTRWRRGGGIDLGDRRPVDLVQAGRAQELLGALSAERAGGFA